MDIYTDYANWKFENYELIEELVKSKSIMISRFNIVIMVVDYLYEQVVNNNKKLEDFEENIFDTGFNYIHDNFLTIRNILSSTFNNDIKSMEKIAKSINLLLYVNDFQNELLNLDKDCSKDLKILSDFEGQVIKLIENKENASDTMFSLLDDISIPIFEFHDIDYISVDQIFYDIALEYNIINDSNNENIFNEIFLKQIEKM